MLWFFQRAEEQLRIETRFDNAAREFVILIRQQGRPETTERFPDTGSLRGRLAALEHSLNEDHWTQQGGPLMLPDGWPMKPST